MNKKTVVTGVIVAIAITALSSAAVFAVTYGAMQGGDHPMMGMRGMMIQKLASDLKLTEAQKQQIAGIYKEFRTENQSDLERMKTLKLDMLNLVSSEAPDKAKAQEMVAEMSTLQSKLMAAGMDKVIEAKQVLTAEQNKILGEKLQHFRPMIEHYPIGR